jgi:hypothetical protein
MIDEREIQYRMRFYRQNMLRERDYDRLGKIALDSRRPGFRLHFKLPRLWRWRKPEGETEIAPKRRPVESGVS